VFVINSLDSLVRLYTDNLNITVKRFGKAKYMIGNILALSLLTLLFKLEFLQIQWVGALVIALFFLCAGFIGYSKFKTVNSIDSSPKANKIDYTKIETQS
jgi:glycine betaine transporter